jgi:hypothetical protein
MHSVESRQGDLEVVRRDQTTVPSVIRLRLVRVTADGVGPFDGMFVQD